jgi:queuine tRNA-ribosyltransferase
VKGDDSLACEIVITRSGARAIVDRNSGEIMHPVVGPEVESTQLYVEPARVAERLRSGQAHSLVIADVGLGAGSNALAAWAAAHRMNERKRRLEIVSFDRSLQAIECVIASDTASSFGVDERVAGVIQTLLSQGRYQDECLDWRLRLGNLPGTFAEEPDRSVDIVFWDPFSPKVNADLWSIACFRAVHRLCRSGATLHTYSRSTAVRTALLLAGFSVGTGVMTGASLETTVAALDVADLERPLDGRFLDRLSRSSAAFPVDAPPDAMATIHALPQFAAR